MTFKKLGGTKNLQKRREKEEVARNTGDEFFVPLTPNAAELPHRNSPLALPRLIERMQHEIIEVAYD